METTLEPDQYVLVDKLTPRFDTYKRGDIVVFNPPEAWQQADGTPYIKRVIGVGGDTVEIHDGKVFVNGTELVEPYVFQEDGEPQPTEDPLQPEKWVVPDGELFLMGDHRGSSADSREFGTVELDKVIGRAWLRYWPINTFEILPTPTHPELAIPGAVNLAARRPRLRRRRGGGRGGVGPRGPGRAARPARRAPRGGAPRRPAARPRSPIAARIAAALLAAG